MVRMKNQITVGDTITGKIYKGIPLMDEDVESTRIVLDCGNVKLNFDCSDDNVIELEE